MIGNEELKQEFQSYQPHGRNLLADISKSEPLTQNFDFFLSLVAALSLLSSLSGPPLPLLLRQLLLPRRRLAATSGDQATRDPRFDDVHTILYRLTLPLLPALPSTCAACNSFLVSFPFPCPEDLSLPSLLFLEEITIACRKFISC